MARYLLPPLSGWFQIIAFLCFLFSMDSSNFIISSPFIFRMSSASPSVITVLNPPGYFWNCCRRDSLIRRLYWCGVTVGFIPFSKAIWKRESLLYFFNATNVERVFVLEGLVWTLSWDIIKKKTLLWRLALWRQHRWLRAAPMELNVSILLKALKSLSVKNTYHWWNMGSVFEVV